MLNMTTSLVGSLELAIMECFWANGPQTGGDILATLRRTRVIAPTTVTTTLARLYDQGLLIRALDDGRKSPGATGRATHRAARYWPARLRRYVRI